MPALAVAAHATRTVDSGFLILLACIVALVCGAPYVVSAVWGPPDLERVGTFWFVRDFSQYEAAMREGAGSTGWLVHDHFSAEPHQAVLMYPLYVGAGKLARLVGADPLQVFAALEWLGRLAVVGSVYAFAATFVARTRARRLAVVLALGTLGLEAFVAPLRLGLAAAAGPGGLGWLPDTIDPYLEMNSFGVLLSAPHLMFGLALTLICAPVYLLAVARHGVWLAVLAASVLALTLIHAFNAPVLIAVLAAHAAWTGRRAWPAAVVAALAAAPMSVYSVLVFGSDPFWSGTYGAQNLMPAPAPWALPFDFGLVLLAAPLAWAVVRGWPAERRRLILLWVGLGLLCMYLPVPYQRRFAFGVQPALAVLAGVGLVWLGEWTARRNWGAVRRRALNYAVAVAAAGTSLLVYVSLLVSAATDMPTQVYLWTRAEADAGQWLSEHSTSDDVVMAATEFANPLAGVIDGRVVHGHIVATFDSDQKQALVRQFYAAGTAADERAHILQQTHATIVAVGPAERALGAASMAGLPQLQLIYARDGVELFRVPR